MSMIAQYTCNDPEGVSAGHGLILEVGSLQAQARRPYSPSDEVRAFTLELVEALSDAAELDVDTSAQEVIAGWRATARIKADPDDHVQARKATRGDFGSAEVPA
ncbi:hypothetical protein IMZ11_21500 [Microtetraspora sp. AC03309]|uniref:hypothetical protein n=1 Tax=Microtetraspora sp. AC03309 TaxID=2779376 RepID=UPI001E55B760|nr:hypothetical protein [Microtetraspora sp. AC03309]MCC5578205.1 hypothetical protein [Microtetraspora sp. AC03309]